jgi:hypothetical protein
MDEELRKRISSLAAYVRRNGKEFEATVKARHHDDPKYPFLFGGLGSEYYCSLLNDEVDIDEDAKGERLSQGRGVAQHQEANPSGSPCPEVRSWPKQRKTTTGWDSKILEAPDYSAVYSSSCPVGLIPALFAQSKGRWSITAQDIEREVARAAETTQEEKDLARKLRNFYSDLHEHLSGVSDRLESQENAQAVESNGTDPNARATKPNPSRKGKRQRQRQAEQQQQDLLGVASPPGLVGDRAGLGAQAEAADLYAAYRQQRSGAYHQRIVGSSTKKKFRRH